MLAELMSAVRGQVEVMSPSDLHIVKYIGSGGMGTCTLHAGMGQTLLSRASRSGQRMR